MGIQVTNDDYILPESLEDKVMYLVLNGWEVSLDLKRARPLYSDLSWAPLDEVYSALNRFESSETNS